MSPLRPAGKYSSDKMKSFDVHTVFESDNYYLFSSDSDNISLSDTKRVTDKRYLTVHEGAELLDAAFILKGLRNVTLDFGGAVITLIGRIQPFIIDGCENITLKNVTVEYERSLFTELDVIRNTGKELVAEIKDKFPCRVENGNFIPYGRDYEDRELYKKGCMFIQAFDKITGEGRGLDVIYLGENIIPEPSPPASNIKHIRVRNEGGNIAFIGEFPSHWDDTVSIVLEHENRFKSSVAMYHSRNIKIENYRILNGCGMGFLAIGTENINLDGVRLFRDGLSHGIVTNSADGIHFVACKGRIILRDSIFEGMIDDALNIHSNFYHSIGAESNRLFARKSELSHALNAYSEVFAVGDEIAVYKGCTLEERGRYKLTGVEIADRWAVTLTTESPIIAEKGDIIENISSNPEIYIESCRFGKANSHLRFQSRGKTVIEGCQFSLPVLLTGDMNYWFEASPVNDFTLKGCTFTGERGRVRIIPDFTPTEKAPYYHKNIRITNNIFGVTEPVEVHGAKDVVIENNVINNGSA